MMEARFGAVVCLAVGLLMAFGPSAAHAQCSTFDADLNGVPDDCPAGTTNVIIGSAASETLTGTDGADCIFGLGGDDTIDGLDGDDYICGGAGNDTIVGGLGNDTLFGETNADTISGGFGDDTIDGGGGSDILNGEGGVDTIFGGAGADTISGGPQPDFIRGGTGADILSGGGDDDDIGGEAGNDTITGDGGNDTITGGAGADDIRGNSGNDIIDGGTENDLIRGGTGDDTISGGDGDDDIRGQGGNDTLNGNAGNDTISGSGGNDVIDGGDGDDTISGGGGDDIINGGPGSDFADGGTGNDILNGGDDPDTLLGNNDDDIINGDGGDDTLLSGGGGNDEIYGGSGSDTIDGGPDLDQIFGGTGNDTIFGGAGPDLLYGEDGNDTIDGGPDNDTIYGGPGAFDSADGSFGFDNCLQSETTVNCELFSHAVVASFGAVIDGTSVVLRWATLSESATVGFYVYRDLGGSWVQVHEGLLPAVYGLAQGGVYDLRDADAQPGVTSRYLLVEVDTSGARTDYGPFEATANVEAMTMLAPGVTFAREAHPMSNGPVAAPKELAGERQRAGEATGIVFGIESTGVYSVPSIEIAARLGSTDEDIRQRLQDGALELTEAGEPVAWTVSPDGSALRFVGFSVDSLFSRERFYRLSLGEGRPMARLSRQPVGESVQRTFVQTVHLEQDLIAGTLVAEDGRSDYWFWQFGSASPSMPVNVEVDIDLESVAPGGVDAIVEIELQGISGVSHEVEAELNGVTLGTATFEGDRRHVAQWTTPASNLVEGRNSLRLVAKGSPESTFYFDSVDVAYERTYQTAARSFELIAAATSDLTVVGDFGDDALVFDVTNRRLPRVIDDFTLGTTSSGTEVTFEAGDGEGYLAAAAESARMPSSIWNDIPSDLRSVGNQAEYLVIAPAELYESARALVEYRRADGLQSMLVELQDVFDEFSAGAPDPEAIRAFLAHARASWAVAPRYVTLVGKGSLDYRDLMGVGGNLLPPIMVHTFKGLYSADNHFADFEGTDNVPELAIGRLPVTTSSELDALIGRLIAYESSLDQLSDALLLVAGDGDTFGTFKAGSDALAERFADDWTISRAYRLDMSLEQFRSTLFEQIERSPRVVHYLGHGGLNLLGKSDTLFHADDVQDLALDSAQPLYLLMTCSASRFEVPGFVSLGETLVLDDDGAVAVWGPSGLSIDEQAQALGRGALERILSRRDVRLGDALLAVYGTILEGDGREDMPAIYHLFGDPALRVSKSDPDPDDPSAPGVPPTTGSEGPGSPGVQSSGGCSVSVGRADLSLFAWLFASVALLRRRRR